jgi:hypothetical protein
VVSRICFRASDVKAAWLPGDESRNYPSTTDFYSSRNRRGMLLSFGIDLVNNYTAARFM